MKRVVIVHGYEGRPEGGWKPWLKKELEEDGFFVEVPAMPNPDFPNLQEWLSCLEKTINGLEEEIFLVGHSLGCISIVRFLETLPEEIKVGGAVFVAPFLRKLEIPKIVEFTENPLEVKKAKKHLLKNISIISEDDPTVPLDIAMDFANKMGSEIVIDNGKGHFGQKSGIKELSSALEAILKISK